MSEGPPAAKVKPSNEPSGPEEDELGGPKEIVLSPSPGPPIIEDTASPPGTDNYAPFAKPLDWATGLGGSNPPSPF